ncbi:MAG: substrate-binding domain-containing protein [Clostridia bacterium]
MKRVIAILMALCMIFAMVACQQPGTPTDKPATDTPTTDATSPEAPAEKMYIPVIAKGFQHQFWQAVAAGSAKAAEDLGVEIYFNGPPSEADIDKQVDMLKTEMAKKPAALALAALSTDAVMEQLKECVDAGIPVIGFDSGVPNAPEGAIRATASTNNKAAAAVAAKEFMKLEGFTDMLATGTEAKPIRIAVLSQDATSESVTGRTYGFIDEMVAQAETVAPGAVAVEGHELFNKPSASPAKIIIVAQVASTPDIVDVTNAAKALLNMDNLKAVFCSNEGSVNGLLAATSDGSDLADGAKYADLIVAGFDAGAPQKAAVRNGWFVGSVTQDPFQIGYKAVELAYKAAKGEAVADTDTGAQWYTAANIDDPAIALLVYD